MRLNISVLRECAGLKQMEAAAAVGVRPPTFCAWEAGACFHSAKQAHKRIDRLEGREDHET